MTIVFGKGSLPHDCFLSMPSHSSGHVSQLLSVSNLQCKHTGKSDFIRLEKQKRHSKHKISACTHTH